MIEDVWKIAEEAGLLEVWGDEVSDGDMHAFIEAFSGRVAGACAKICRNNYYYGSPADCEEEIRAAFPHIKE